jgi:predicted transcriptional regulator
MGMPTIAYLVHKHLVDTGIPEKTLAERFGVSQRAVSKWRTGEAEPSERILYRAWAKNNDGFAGVLLAIKMPAFRAAIAEQERRS